MNTRKILQRDLEKLRQDRKIALDATASLAILWRNRRVLYMSDAELAALRTMMGRIEFQIRDIDIQIDIYGKSTGEAVE